MTSAFVAIGTVFCALCTLTGSSISAGDWQSVASLAPYLATAGTLSLAIALQLASTPRSRSNS